MPNDLVNVLNVNNNHHESEETQMVYERKIMVLTW